jgi:Holliday junction resolvase
MAQPERLLERQIINYLRFMGCVAIKVRTSGRIVNGIVRSLPKDELGVSDIVGCYKGKFFAIEVKIGKNKLSEYQDKFQKAVQNSHGIAFTAYGLDDVKRLLFSENP